MSAPVSFIECVSKMAYTRVLSCVMLALIYLFQFLQALLEMMGSVPDIIQECQCTLTGTTPSKGKERKGTLFKCLVVLALER